MHTKKKFNDFTVVPNWQSTKPRLCSKFPLFKTSWWILRVLPLLCPLESSSAYLRYCMTLCLNYRVFKKYDMSNLKLLNSLKKAQQTKCFRANNPCCVKLSVFFLAFRMYNTFFRGISYNFGIFCLNFGNNHITTQQGFG